MDQELNFFKYYQGLTPEEISDEINTLANIRLSVDFYEYIATDPEKLLAIIHYNNLEEKYGIKVVFDSDEQSKNQSELTDHTGNMSILFRFNNDIYHISTMIDSVSNNSIYDSFVEQILFLLNNYKTDIISREEKLLSEYEKVIKQKYIKSVNLMWYILNSPKNIKELMNDIDNLPDEFEKCNSDNEEHTDHIKDNVNCPQLVLLISIAVVILLRYFEITRSFQ